MIAFLIAFQIVAGAAPETKGFIAGIFDPAECVEHAAMMNDGPPTQNDPDGRVVMMRKYECVLIHFSDVQTAKDSSRQAEYHAPISKGSRLAILRVRG